MNYLLSKKQYILWNIYKGVVTNYGKGGVTKHEGG